MRRIVAVASIGLGAVLPGMTPAYSQQPTPWCFDGVHPGETTGTVWLPQGDLFCPLLADPKAEHSFLSYLRGEFPSFEGDVVADEDLNLGSIGLADSFGFVRFAESPPGNGFQIGLVGGIFSQFNLDAESFDLINADYLVGLPLTYRHSGFSSRLRVYHQSSHLGDEFLLRTELERENLSFEAAELLFSQEFGPLRLYGGGEIFFNREPETLESSLLHGGVEVRWGVLRGPRFVGAVDVKSTEQQDWEPAWSVRAGIEVAHWRDRSHPPRLWSILGEFYDGPSPYGQFFRDDVRSFGVGLHLTL